MKKLLLALFTFTFINTSTYAGGGASKNNLPPQLLAINPSEQLYKEEPAELFNALASAIKNNDLFFVKRTITEALLTNLTPPGKLTLLQIAVLFERPEIVAFLIEKGVNVNTRHFLGNTALHLAAQMISKKANAQQELSITTTERSTNTNTSTYTTHGQQVPQEPSISTNDPVYIILYQLLEAGASPIVKNYENKSPLDLLTIEALKNKIINDYVGDIYITGPFSFL